MSSTSAFPSPRPGPALPRVVWAIGGAVVLVLLVLAGAYGFFNDEMYFILAGRHLDFGYVDQPPLTPLLSAAAAQLFGASPVAVRLLPAVAAGIGIPVCADMARRMSGSARAQFFAALLLAISFWTPAAHLDSTTTFDLLFWTLATWLLVALLASPDLGRDWRLWLALGLVMGIALENKSVPVFLAASLAGGVLLARRWDIVRSRGLWVAIAIALVIWAPNVIWQAANGWPVFAMAQAIASGQQSVSDRIGELIDLLLLPGPFVFPVAIAGLIWLRRGSASRAWRPLGIATLIAIALMFVTAGKYYYAAGFIPLALAAGPSSSMGGFRAAASGSSGRSSCRQRLAPPRSWLCWACRSCRRPSCAARTPVSRRNRSNRSAGRSLRTRWRQLVLPCPRPSESTQ